MKEWDAGISGLNQSPTLTSWGKFNLDEPWKEVIQVLIPEKPPRQVQEVAIKKGLLTSNANIIIAAPTNAGKSLVGLLPLFQSVQRGKRAILLEPLKAIAREKYEELNAVAKDLSKALGKKFSVQISTGDYRIENEKFSSPPPEGEILIATPERLDALRRNPEFDPWFDQIGCVCVDEAHLLGDKKRGLTLEFLLTSLLSLQVPPRIILLSATLGSLEKLKVWLRPCILIEVKERYPILHKFVLEAEHNEDSNQLVKEWIDRHVLPQPQNQALIFVYQTSSGEKLAREINKHFSDKFPQPIALPYHAQMSSEKREQTRTAFLRGEAKVVVTTTALSMGINLPATHVLIRDVTFLGVGNLSIGDFNQMLGRAGRGNQEGYGYILLKPSDRWTSSELVDVLQRNELSEFTPASLRAKDNFRYSSSSHFDQAANLVAAFLARQDKEKPITNEGLQSFFSQSLAGQDLLYNLEKGLNWLVSNTLGYRDEEGKVGLTSLGRSATLAVLPLPTAAGIGQVFRDLMTIDEKDDYLSSWSIIDNLFVLDILQDSHAVKNIRFSKALQEMVDVWFEKNSYVGSILYQNWIKGEKGFSKAEEVLGSLGVQSPQQKNNKGEWARQEAYKSLFRMVLLYEISEGNWVKNVEKQFRVSNLEGVQEKLRDEMLWLLSGLIKIFEVPNFYFHLKEHCKVSDERLSRISKRFKEMQFEIYEFLENVKYCSPLGRILYQIRTNIKSTTQRKTGLGLESMKRLSENGVTSLKDLRDYSVEDLCRMGVRRPQAEIIVGYVRRRML